MVDDFAKDGITVIGTILTFHPLKRPHLIADLHGRIFLNGANVVIAD